MKLPSDTELQLLALLGSNEYAGRDLAKRYESEVGERISYGTLYTTLRRMAGAKWVSIRDDEDEDGRIKFFKITGGGRAALNEGRQYHIGMFNFMQEAK